MLRGGVYRLSDLGDDQELKRFRGAEAAYSFWGAVKYTLVLTLLLWWLPIFGQIIAGYVGGRRAGSPKRAILAALVPVMFIFVIMLCFDVGLLPSTINGVNLDPRNIFNGSSTGIPIADPYFSFALLYIQSFMGAVHSVILLRLDSYILTLAFAYIGGIMAMQTRRELEYVSEHGGHKTNIMVGRDMEPDRAPLRTRSFIRSRSRSAEADLDEQRGFADLQPLEGDAQVDDESVEQPVHTTRRHIAEQASQESPRTRRAVEGRVRAMEQEQKKVERKVRQRSPAAGLAARAAKRPVQKPPTPEKEQNEGGYEYI